MDEFNLLDIPTTKFSKTDLLRERFIRTCRGSGPQDADALRFFLRNFVYIQHPERGSIPFDLRPAQEEILDVWLTERMSIVLKARQIGWSTLVACYALWLCLFFPDNTIIMLSKGEREAEKLLAKATYAYERIPVWMRERLPKRLTKNLKKLAFNNSSVIESLPSKEDPARSSTASLVVVDEWAFLENPEEAWASIEPVADVGGRVIGLSTANGSGDFFHTFYVMAEENKSDFKPMFYPWWANDERDDDWYESKKRSLLEWQLHQEYPSSAEEAFIKSGKSVFDHDILNDMPTNPPIERGNLSILGHGLRKPEFEFAENGPLRVWAPPNPTDTYVIGADVAEGLDYGDFSVAYVISVKESRVVACWHGHIPSDQFGERIAELAFYYYTALVGVEVNNHGLSTIHQLQRMHYPRLFFRQQLDRRTKEWLPSVGWNTNKQSKPVMIDELARAVRLELLVEDEEAISEMRHYVRDDKGQMHGSPFDDRVMALAIAWQMVGQAHLQAPPVAGGPPAGSFQFFMDRVLEESERNRLGAEGHLGQFNVRATRTK